MMLLSTFCPWIAQLWHHCASGLSEGMTLLFQWTVKEGGVKVPLDCQRLWNHSAAGLLETVGLQCHWTVQGGSVTPVYYLEMRC